MCQQVEPGEPARNAPRRAAYPRAPHAGRRIDRRAAAACAAARCSGSPNTRPRRGAAPEAHRPDGRRRQISSGAALSRTGRSPCPPPPPPARARAPSPQRRHRRRQHRRQGQPRQRRAQGLRVWACALQHGRSGPRATGPARRGPAKVTALQGARRAGGRGVGAGGTGGADAGQHLADVLALYQLREQSRPIRLNIDTRGLHQC